MIKHNWIIIFSAITLLSCVSDVSNDAEYNYLVGKTFISKKELLIHGIKTDYDKGIDYYLITPKPGIAGRSVITYDKLSPSTIIEIDKVIYTSFCLGCSYHIEVKIISENNFRDHPVKLKNFADTDILIKENNLLKINSELFTEINTDTHNNALKEGSPQSGAP